METRTGNFCLIVIRELSKILQIKKLFRHRDLVNALKRHFRPELRAEKISFSEPALQGFRAFDPNQRRTLAQKYEERFPRTPVDWHQNKWGSRQATSSKGTYNELDRQLQRQRSGENLPQAKAQKTLHR